MLRRASHALAASWNQHMALQRHLVCGARDGVTGASRNRIQSINQPLSLSLSLGLWLNLSPRCARRCTAAPAFATRCTTSLCAQTGIIGAARAAPRGEGKGRGLCLGLRCKTSRVMSSRCWTLPGLSCRQAGVPVPTWTRPGPAQETRLREGRCKFFDGVCTVLF